MDVNSIIQSKLANILNSAQLPARGIVNERPTIGIITQVKKNEDYNYIMAAYVKFVEQSGSRVVPINPADSDEHILDLMSKINGVIYPGGGTPLIDEDGLTEYSKKGKLILDKAKEMNDEGIHFPVWAICLGIQEVALIEAPYQDVLLSGYFDSYNYANNVTFVSNLAKSKMFSHMPQHLINALKKENITFNSHHDGVVPQTFEKYDSLKEYNVLAVSYDNDGVEYVASIEHKRYPIFAHQYHPEKNAFIWKESLVVPHTQNAIELQQYYANFFIGEAKKNTNKFDSEEELISLLVENASVLFTTGESQDIYVFE